MMVPSEEADEKDAEAVRAKMAMKPELPSAEERQSHQLTHQPYRNWCRY